MTTYTHTKQGKCQGCGKNTLTNYRHYCWECIDTACREGDGAHVGLQSVAGHKQDAAVTWAADHIYALPMDMTPSRSTHDEECMFCKLLDPVCGECGDIDARDIPSDDEEHIIVDAFVLVCCEGYHTPAFRWAALHV